LSAAAIAGELGHVDRLGSVANQSSYAGIIPGTEQTGGPDQPAKSKRVRPRCNHRLKKHLVHTANHMGLLTGSVEFRSSYNALKLNGQHADFIMARRLLRMSKCLMKNRTVYLPPALRGAGLDRSAYFEYLVETWPRLRSKWHSLGALEVAFAPDAALGIWRELVRRNHGIELALESGRVSLTEGQGVFKD
jgi:hypothetical protein